jgi:hypothetical protein
MASGDELRVRPADLITHAAHIEALADAVSTARQAGEVVRLDGGAYGKLCWIVPALLDGLQGTIFSGMNAAVHSLHDTGERLRSVAQGYESTDTASAAHLNSVRNRL